MNDSSKTNQTTVAESDEARVTERARIAKQNMPFLDDETADLVAQDELHTGKINPTSRQIDDERARDAQADDATR